MYIQKKSKSISKEKNFYHCSKCDFDRFTRELDAEIKQQYGDGFYFTEKKDEALSKIQENGISEFSGILYEVSLNIKDPIIINNTAEENLTNIYFQKDDAYQILMKNPAFFPSDGYDHIHDDNPLFKLLTERYGEKDYKSLITQLMESDDFETICCFDTIEKLYNGFSDAFHTAIHEVTGKDGILIKNNDVEQAVAWNPEDICIKNKSLYGLSSLPYRTDIRIETHPKQTKASMSLIDADAFLSAKNEEYSRLNKSERIWFTINFGSDEYEGIYHIGKEDEDLIDKVLLNLKNSIASAPEDTDSLRKMYDQLSVYSSHPIPSKKFIKITAKLFKSDIENYENSMKKINTVLKEYADDEDCELLLNLENDGEQILHEEYVKEKLKELMSQGMPASTLLLAVANESFPTEIEWKDIKRCYKLLEFGEAVERISQISETIEHIEESVVMIQ